MSARNPSTYDFTYDETALLPGAIVKTTVPNVVLNNQQFILDRPQLIFSTVFDPTANGGTGREPVFRCPIYFDLCGVSATAAVYAHFLAYDQHGVGGVTYYAEAEFQNVTAGPTLLQAAFTTQVTAPVWSAIVGPVNMKSDGEEIVIIYANGNGAVNTVAVCGVAIYSAER